MHCHVKSVLSCLQTYQCIICVHQVDVSKDGRALQKLRREAERAKRALSSQHQVRVEVESLAEGVDLSEPLTRARFEELNNDLFKKTLGPVKRVCHCFCIFHRPTAFWSNAGLCMDQLGHNMCNLAAVRAGQHLQQSMTCMLIIVMICQAVFNL